MTTRKIVAEIELDQNQVPGNPHSGRIYDSLEIHGLLPGSKQEREKGSKGKKLKCSTMEALNESYMPEKCKTAAKVENLRNHVELWDIIRPLMLEKLSGPSYMTWIEPLKAIGYDGKSLVIAARSDFNREQIQKRFRKELQTILSELTDGTITDVKVEADESIEHIIPKSSEPETRQPQLIDKRNKWGMIQNPTNNPDVDALLRKHGDMRIIFQKNGLFDIPLKPSTKGGWNLRFDSLMSHGNQYGLERIVWAVLYVMQEVKEDRSITQPGGLFYYAVKNGLKPDSMNALRKYL